MEVMNITFTPAAITQGLFVSPEAMLAYCRTRLSSLDDDIQKHFDQQQKSAAARETLNEVQGMFTKGADGDESYWSFDSQKMKTKMEELKAKWEKAGYDPTQFSEIEEMLFGKAGDADGKLNSDEWDKFNTDMKNLATNVSSASELDMISLQALMSQRQTAIQLTTNLLNSMTETTKGIVANVK